jgi:hypothetical protein
LTWTTLASVPGVDFRAGLDEIFVAEDGVLDENAV